MAGLAAVVTFALTFGVLGWGVFAWHGRWNRRRGPASGTDWGEVANGLGLQVMRGVWRMNLGGVRGEVEGLGIEIRAEERLGERTVVEVALGGRLEPPLEIRPRFGAGERGVGRLGAGFEVTSRGCELPGQVISRGLAEALLGCWGLGLPVRLESGGRLVLEVPWVGLSAAQVQEMAAALVRVGALVQRDFEARVSARSRETVVLSPGGGRAVRPALRMASGAVGSPRVREVESGGEALFANTLGESGSGAPQTEVRVELPRGAGFEVRVTPTLWGGRSSLYLGDHTFDMLYAVVSPTPVRARALLVEPLRERLVELARRGAPVEIAGGQLRCRVEGVRLPPGEVDALVRAMEGVARVWGEAADMLERCARQVPWAVDGEEGPTIREAPRSCHEEDAVVSSGEVSSG